MKEEAFQSSIFSKYMRILCFLNIVSLYSLKIQLKLKLFNFNCIFTSFFQDFRSFFRISLGLFKGLFLGILQVLNFRDIYI